MDTRTKATFNSTLNESMASCSSLAISASFAAMLASQMTRAFAADGQSGREIRLHNGHHAFSGNGMGCSFGSVGGANAGASHARSAASVSAVASASSVASGAAEVEGVVVVVVAGRVAFGRVTVSSSDLQPAATLGSLGPEDNELRQRTAPNAARRVARTNAMGQVDS